MTPQKYLTRCAAAAAELCQLLLLPPFLPELQRLRRAQRLPRLARRPDSAKCPRVQGMLVAPPQRRGVVAEGTSGELHRVCHLHHDTKEGLPVCDIDGKDGVRIGLREVNGTNVRVSTVGDLHRLRRRAR